MQLDHYAKNRAGVRLSKDFGKDFRRRRRRRGGDQLRPMLHRLEARVDVRRTRRNTKAGSPRVIAQWIKHLPATQAAGV